MVCTWAAPPTCMSSGLRAYQGVKAHIQGSRANNTPRQTANPPKCRPVQPKEDIFSDFRPMGLYFGGHTTSKRGRAATNRGGMTSSKPPTRRRHAARGLRMAQNPHRHRPVERRWHGGHGRSAREQRQGGAITRHPARGLRQSTTQLAQQQTHQAPPVQNSPRTPALTACAVQNSPCSPEMAQFGAFSACRESFVPLWLAQHRAGRILYRMRGRVAASHDSTTRPTSAEGTGGPGRGARG